MNNWLIHIYSHAEVYTVLLAWIVVPLGFYGAFLFFKNHYSFFDPAPPVSGEEKQNGSN